METWVKTEIPEPIIRELEALLRHAQQLLGKPTSTEEPITFAVQHGGKVIGSLHRRTMYGDDGDANPDASEHD